MENLELWWNSLSADLQVFWGISIVSTVAFLIMFGMSMFGGDADSDMDGDTDCHCDGDCHCGADADADSGIFGYVFSLKSILAFILGASWTGLSALYQGWAFPIVIIVSILAGMLVMGVTAFILYSFVKLQYSSTMTMDKTIGCTGEVYFSVLPDMKTGGQVEILVNNSYKTYEAVCNDSEPIRPKEKIVVLDVLDDNVLLVGRMAMPLDDPDTKAIE